MMNFFYIDLNEILGRNAFVISPDNFKTNSQGNRIELYIGMDFFAYSDELSDDGREGYLIFDAKIQKCEDYFRTQVWPPFECIIDPNSERWIERSSFPEYVAKYQNP